jgi:hypothetical protein
MSDASAFDRLFALVTAFLANALSTGDFCERFEDEFNLRSKRMDLSKRQNEIFGQLFEEVVLYSPYPEDRASYSGYRDESAIRSAAERAWQALQT